MKDERFYDRGLAGGLNTFSARRYWEGVERDELQVQQCGSCGDHVFPPQDVCPFCWSEDLNWVRVSGRGTVYSFSTIYIDLRADWSEQIPYTFAIVELQEGAYLFSTIVDCAPEEIEIDMPVEVVYRELPGLEGHYPQFKPTVTS